MFARGFLYKQAGGWTARRRPLATLAYSMVLAFLSVVVVVIQRTQAIDLGVSCRPEPEEETELTVLCLRNTAYDICQVCEGRDEENVSFWSWKMFPFQGTVLSWETFFALGGGKGGRSDVTRVV